MSDTPSELRMVVDRSYETILISNNLPSTSSVFSHDMLGSMHEEAPSLEMMVPPTENTYMVHEDDDISPCLLQDGHVDHMDPPTSTTPTSN